MSSLNNFLIILIFFSNLISLIASLEACLYQERKDGPILYTNNTTLANIELLTEKKQACFDYSYSEVFNQLCCYNNKEKICTNDTNTNHNISCPKPKLIPNNCGISGIYQPESENACIQINLVEGYCCYVELQSGDRACVKTNKLNSEKNSATEMMLDYINKYNMVMNKNLNLTDLRVVCQGFNINYFFKMLSILLILLF